MTGSCFHAKISGEMECEILSGFSLTTSHYTALDCIALHYITCHHITWHYATKHSTTLHCIALHYFALHSITLRYITLHQARLHYTRSRTLNYVRSRCITLPLRRSIKFGWVSLHCSTLHCIAFTTPTVSTCVCGHANAWSQTQLLVQPAHLCKILAPKECT